MRKSVAALGLVCLLCPTPGSADEPGRGVVALSDPTVLLAFRLAHHEALRKLERPACREVVFDFGEEAGRVLNEKLAAAGSAGAFLETLSFTDRDGRASCLGGAHAFTYPGSPLIFLCGRRFREATRQEVARGADMLIHEMLHALGLGENPPSSREIQNAVERRCRG